MIIQKVTEDNIKETLINMFGEDEDFSGRNGLGFTSREAKRAGYKNDALYYADKSYSKYKESMDLEAMIFQMYKEFINIHGNYWLVDIGMEKIDGLLIMAVSAQYKG